MSSCAALLAPLVLLFLILSHGSNCSKATDADLCSSSCGMIHNISHPFRLKDRPEHCGDHRYNLSCEDNQLVLYWKSGRYYVQSINYNNYTIRLVDAAIRPNDYSSLPPYSLTSYNFSSITGIEKYQDYLEDGPKRWRWNKLLLYLRCPYQVDSSDLYVDDSTATCMNGSYALGSTFYVIVEGKSLGDLGLGDSCRIEFMYITSWPAQNNLSNISCRDFHNMLLYGFELSWLPSRCSFIGYDTDFHDHNSPRCRSNFYGMYFEVSKTPGSGLIVNLVINRVFGALFLIIILICQWRRRHLSFYDSIEGFLQSDNNIMPIRYSYKDMKRITEGFKIKLGSGGYGCVFRGQLRSGRLVAVKILDKAKANGQDFINEVATIGRIHHVNVVQLIGFCAEGSKRALIYEFMPNGSLEKYIFSPEESSTLSCEKLHAISLGVARGIGYLHNGCDMKILHFDIKPHNILLDENLNPKVSDFGLARLYPTDKSDASSTTARGTIGYMAPELFYRNVGTISYKADVYSFGMLLMEMASRRKNLNALTEHSSQIYFPFWVYDQLHDGKEITIENDTDEEMKLVKKMMIVALWCIQTKPCDRPSMEKVLVMLETKEELQMPRKPYLYPQDLPTSSREF